MRSYTWILGSLLAALGMPLPALASADTPPAVVALALDTSGSLSAEDLQLTRRLALGILQSLPAGSQVAILTFDDQSRILAERTSDPGAVQAALDSISISGRYTALHDALYDASRYLREAPSQRRAVVLLTDGKNENSALNLEDGLGVARENEIPVFAVGVGRRVQARVLRRIARLTGGRYLTGREVEAQGLASAIMELPVAEPPPPPTSTLPPSPPTASTAATPFPWFEAALWSILGAGLIVAALALALRARSQPKPRCPVCDQVLASPEAACPTCASDAVPFEPSDLGSGSETVIVKRDDDLEAEGGTMVLTTNPVLMITRGAQVGTSIDLPMTTATSLGRGPSNDIVIADTAVSSQHCRIRPEQGRFVLHDLQSTNGTFVNEKRVGRHALLEGDVIRLGETWLEFRMHARV